MSKPIKVLRVITRLNIGGPSKQIFTLRDLSERRQISQTLVTGSVSKNEEEFDFANFENLIRVKTLQREINPILDLISLLSIARVIHQLKPEIIHTHLSKAWLLTSMAKALVNSKAKTIHTFHGHTLHSYFGKIKHLLMLYVIRTLARGTNVLIAVNSRVRDQLLESGIGSSAQFQVIEPGISSFARIDKSDAKRRLGLKQDIFTIVFVGRLEQIKRPEIVVNVVRKIVENYGFTHVQNLICGGGTLETQLKSAATGLPIYFESWKSDLSDVYSCADLMLLASDNEGSPLTIIEAGKMGVPTMARDVGGITSLIINEETGFICGNTQEEIYQSILRIMADEKKLQKVSENCVLHFNTNFNSAIFLKKHEELYKSIS